MRLLLRVKTSFLNKWEYIKSLLNNENYISSTLLAKWRELVIERNEEGKAGNDRRVCVTRPEEQSQARWSFPVSDHEPQIPLLKPYFFTFL